MEIVRGLHNIRDKHCGCVITVGNFDGCHLGHQKIVSKLLAVASMKKVPASVVTFEPLPQEVFLPSKARRLMSFREKAYWLKAWGVDRVVCLKFNPFLRAQTAEDFLSQVLVKKLGAEAIVVGEDFQFGCGRQGDVALLGRLAQKEDFLVYAVNGECVAGNRVSSTRIREALGAGDFGEAESLLGRQYQLSGRVEKGFQQGRLLGFPTANVKVFSEGVPLRGVFVVQAKCDDAPERYWGLANIGTRPTFRQMQAPRLSVEVHLLDFCGDIYGKRLTVTFLQKIRDEQKFDSIFALKAQMREDVCQARDFQNRQEKV